jgi:two-component system nitrate/nitrite response regulator NarL
MEVRSSLTGNSIDTHMRSPITIVIADDHRLFLEALKKLLEADPGVRVIGEAGNGRDAIRLATELRPDILLLDLLMPVIPGLTVLRELSKLPSPVRCLVLTAEVGDSDVIEALRLGACGVMMKHTTTELLFKGIHAVMAGQYWVGRECVADLVECMRQRSSPAGAAPRHPTCGLTARQLDIVSAVVAGATNRDIAEQFSISAKTVKYHLTNMFDKLGVSNRVELALFAVQHRLDPTLHQHLTNDN